MGIENLQNAARAAGFAMVASDEPLGELRNEPATSTEAWRPGPALLKRDSIVERGQDSAAEKLGDWVKTMIGATGRAPA